MSRWLNDDTVAVLTKRGYAEWVSDIGSIVDGLLGRFHLTAIAPLEGGTMSAVIHCKTQEGTDVVLKASPNTSELKLERQFLARVPLSTPRILDATTEALVLEFLSGAPERGQLPDGVAVTALAKMQLWSREEPGVLLDVDDMLEVIVTRLSVRDVALAKTLTGYGPVIRERWGEPAVWCHGDLQGENVFWDGESLRAIDPLPVWAPQGMDIGYWAADPLRGSLPARRLELLSSAFAMPFEEIVAWVTLGAAQHVSWLWHYDVGPDLSARAESSLRSLLRLHTGTPKYS